MNSIVEWFLNWPAQLHAALISAIAALIVALAIWLLGRRRDMRDLTLELHKEYYAKSMRRARHQASNFIRKHCDKNWSDIDPYRLSGSEEEKDGFSEVVRYFHRLGVLYKENEIRKSLIRRLLSREFGFWYSYLFHPMRDRSDWWTKKVILDLDRLFSKKEGSQEYDAGAQSGRLRRANAAARLAGDRLRL